MITTLLAVFSGGLGGILRLIPEVLKLFSDSADRKHEKAMTELQLEIDKARSEQNIDAIHAQAAVTQDNKEADAYIAALQSQSTLTGVHWADALSKTVRPIITYWWMILFTIVKITIIVYSAMHFSDINTFLNTVWTTNDISVLAMILGFWFVDRSMRKYREH